MKVKREVKPLIFRATEAEVRVRYDNEGEPFREGVSLEFARDGYRDETHVLLDVYEVKQLRDKLDEFLGVVRPAGTADPVAKATVEVMADQVRALRALIAALADQAGGEVRVSVRDVAALSEDVHLEFIQDEDNRSTRIRTERR